MDNATRNKIKGIAIYQIAGGILGIILTAWVMYNSGMVIDQNALRMGLLAAGLFVFSILCGRMLLRTPARGLKLSIVNQVLQVIYFSFGTYGFQYVAGLRIGIGVDMVGSWVFKFRVALSSFHFNLDTDIGQKFIGINLIALFLIFWMEQLMEKVKD